MDGHHYMYEAAETGNTHIAQLILNTEEERLSLQLKLISGASPLYIAAEKNRSGIVRLLLNYPGTDVNQANNVESTPLHSACERGYSKVAKILIKHNATIDKLNKYEATPLYYAISNGHEDLTPHLVLAS